MIFIGISILSLYVSYNLYKNLNITHITFYVEDRNDR